MIFFYLYRLLAMDQTYKNILLDSQLYQLPELLINLLINIPNINEKTGLEIGIGGAQRSIPISNFFKRYVGVEPDIELFNKSNNEIKKHNPNFTTYNMTFDEFISKKVEKYDVIIFINAIEFCIKPQHFFETAFELADYIIVVTPRRIPRNWGSPKLNIGSELFDRNIWTKKKAILSEFKKILKHDNRLIKRTKDDKSTYYLFKKN